MKTFKNLYPRICDSENIWLAYRRASRGKRLNVNVARPEGAENRSLRLQPQAAMGNEFFRPEWAVE